MVSRHFVMAVVVALGVAFSFAVSVHVSASVTVYPARIEAEIPVVGARSEVNFINRGDARVQVRLYGGMGTHDIDGTPVYSDDAASRQESARWITIESPVVDVPPGETSSVWVTFHPVRGAVAAYPVIMAEMHPREFDDDSNDGSGGSVPAAIPRLAIPLLLTYEQTGHLREKEIQVERLSLRSLEEDRFEVEVLIRNKGNVHGSVGGHIDWLTDSGETDERIYFSPIRLLPGRSRTLRMHWHPGDIVGRELRFLARFYGDDGSGPELLAAFHLPSESPEWTDIVPGTLLHAAVLEGHHHRPDANW